MIHQQQRGVRQPAGILVDLRTEQVGAVRRPRQGHDRLLLIRLDLGGPESRHRLGVWHCTAGAFECTERGDELQTILAGHLRLVRADGYAQTFGPGDSFFTRKGERLLWDILEDVTKVFFTHDRDGRPDEDQVAG